jgi:hypothetical protein
VRRFFNLKKGVLFVGLLFLVGGCGYAPNAKFSRDVMGEKISTSVVISAEDPQNTVVIKDAVDKAVIEVFQASLTTKEASDSHLVIQMNKPIYTPVVYDENGYVTGYRMSVVLHIVRDSKGVSRKYQTQGFHDFSVAPNAIVTDQDRFNAIGFAAQRAIRAFVAQVSAEGARAKK